MFTYFSRTTQILVITDGWYFLNFIAPINCFPDLNFYFPFRFYNEWCTCFKKVCRSFYCIKDCVKPNQNIFLWYVIYSYKHYTQAHTIIITKAILSKKKRKRRGSKFFFTPHIKTCFLLISRISKEHLWQARKRASRCEAIFSAVICGKNVISNLTSNQNKMSSEVNDEYKSWATIKEGYSFYCQDLYCYPCGKYLWKTSFFTICGANRVRILTIFKGLCNSV